MEAGRRAELGEQRFGDALGFEEHGHRRRRLPQVRALAEREQDRGAQRLVGELARRVGQEHAPDFEDPHGRRPGATGCASRRAAARAASVVREERPHAGHRVREPHAAAKRSRPPAGAARRGPRARSVGISRISTSPAAFKASRVRSSRTERRRTRDRRERRARQRRLDRVVAVDARDLLDQVLGDRQIVAPARHACSAARFSTSSRACTPTRAEQRDQLLGAELRAEQAVRVRGIEGDLAGAVRRRAARLDASARDRTAGQLGEQARGAIGGARDAVRIDAALEAIRRLAAQAEALRGAAHAGRRELRALDQDVARGRADLGLGAAHHAGDRDRALGVGDHQVVRVRGRASRRRAWRSSRPAARGARGSRRRAGSTRSNACSGWPSSSSTRLVTSTTTLIARMPAASSRAASQAGDGPTCTPRTTRPT